jgi:hypothetical protein
MKTTLTYFCWLCLVLGVAGNAVSGQEASSKETQFVVMPRDIGQVLVVAEPESPLEFVETKLLLNLSSRLWAPSFRLRNCGTKPIRAFTVAAAGAGERSWKADSPAKYLIPGQIMALNGDGRDDEIVPLTEELRNRLGLRGPMKGITALLVVSAEYADGSHFQEGGYEELTDYLDTVRGILSDPRFKRREESSPSGNSPRTSQIRQRQRHH